MHERYIMNMLKDNYEFMLDNEIIKEIAKKLKEIRKEKFKTQNDFATHIGIKYSRYARFEKSGQVQFIDFIKILRGLNRLDEIVDLFEHDKNAIEWEE